MSRERGFALLLVLWSLVGLSLILAHLLAAGRSETQLAGNLRAAAQAEAVADGAVQEALFHLAAAGRETWATGGTHMLRIGPGVAEVTVEDLSGKLNPNTASSFLLRALLANCGAGQGEASQLAQAIAAWRGTTGLTSDALAQPYRAAGRPYAPPGVPLQTIDELGLVIGMRPTLLACIAPHLSLLQEGDPGTRGPDLVVAAAVALAVQAGEQSDSLPLPSTAVRVTATARVPGGRFVRQATARLAVADGEPFRIVGWGTPRP